MNINPSFYQTKNNKMLEVNIKQMYKYFSKVYTLESQTSQNHRQNDWCTPFIISSQMGLQFCRLLEQNIDYPVLGTEITNLSSKDMSRMMNQLSIVRYEKLGENDCTFLFGKWCATFAHFSVWFLFVRFSEHVLQFTPIQVQQERQVHPAQRGELLRHAVPQPVHILLGLRLLPPQCCRRHVINCVKKNTKS